MKTAELKFFAERSAFQRPARRRHFGNQSSKPPQKTTVIFKVNNTKTAQLKIRLFAKIIFVELNAD